MPILDLRDNPRRNAHVVLTTMMFPKDAKRRAQLLAQVEVAEMAPSQVDSVPLRLAKELVEAPPFTVDSMDPKHTGWGWDAGTLLLYMAAMEGNGVKATKRKALFCLSKFLFGGRTFEGKGVNYDKNSLEDNWYKFRSVAHLWAAWNLFLTDEQSRFYGDWFRVVEGERPLDEAFECFSEEKLPEFLALAEWFRHFGEHHRPPQQRYGTTLRKDETWRVPQTYVLPKLQVSIPMPPLMPEVLKQYKARA